MPYWRRLALALACTTLFAHTAVAARGLLQSSSTDCAFHTNFGVDRPVCNFLMFSVPKDECLYLADAEDVTVAFDAAAQYCVLPVAGLCSSVQTTQTVAACSSTNLDAGFEVVHEAGITYEDAGMRHADSVPASIQRAAELANLVQRFCCATDQVSSYTLKRAMYTITFGRSLDDVVFVWWHPFVCTSWCISPLQT